MTIPLDRRTFVKTTSAAALGLSALGAGRVIGANDRIRLGVIGTGNRGCQVMAFFLKHPGVEVPALCDVSRSAAEAANARLLGGKADLCSDFRKITDRKDIDAVLIATPDHWHALQTIIACRAGKDVYCEKPLSKTIHEGRRMVEVARSTGRVVQMGTHRRSGHSYAEAAKLIASGKLGKITVTRAFDTTNMYPKGIGKAAPSDPPKDLDWEMWLGPRPSRPYQATITPFKFRWWDLYASRFSDNGVHFLDIMRWLIGDEPGPVRISALGGCFAIDDDRTTPDAMEGMFQFPSGPLTSFAQYEASGNRAMPRQAFAEFRGTQGPFTSTTPASRCCRSAAGATRTTASSAWSRSRRSSARVTRSTSATTRGISWIACDRAKNPMPTWRSATAPPAWPCWPTSRWPPSPRSTGIPSASESPTSPRPTTSCITSIASPGRSRTHRILLTSLSA